MYERILETCLPVAPGHSPGCGLYVYQGVEAGQRQHYFRMLLTAAVISGFHVAADFVGIRGNKSTGREADPSKLSV